MSATRKWIHGLLGTTINGVASGILLMVADPATFNLHDWPKLLTVCGLLGLLGMANYLKQSPLPDYGDYK